MLLISILSLNCYHVSAQYLYEIGFGGGMSGYSGEVSNNPFTSPGYTYGAFYRSNISSRIAVRFEMGYGKIGGDTKDILPETYPAAQGICDLTFLTSFISTELIMEVNFFPYPFQKVVMNSSNITPYSFIGVGMEKYNSNSVLGTTMAIPFGVGAKWMFSKQWGLQFQFKTVKMFTDDFDCLQLDNPFELEAGGLHRQDWLYTTTLMLTYSFGENIWDCNCPGGYKRKRKR